jgi:hypothetical protein
MDPPKRERCLLRASVNWNIGSQPPKRGSQPTMDKRYQVFLSSTYTDLIAERQAVLQGLLDEGNPAKYTGLHGASRTTTSNSK